MQNDSSHKVWHTVDLKFIDTVDTIYFKIGQEVLEVQGDFHHLNTDDEILAIIVKAMRNGEVL